MSSRKIIWNVARNHGVKRIAEVGVWSGAMSKAFATLPELEELILIDPWTAGLNNFEEDGEVYRCTMGTNKTLTQVQCDALADEVSARFADNHKVTIYRMTSWQASEVIPDGSLDMVFIDAIHLYEHTKRDIELWVPKLREGGIISGDDYSRRFKGVQRAVDELGGCNIERDKWWKMITKWEK